MKRITRFLLISGAAAIAMSGTAYAGMWKQSQNGWYWEEDDGTVPAATWKWLDGNQDGIAECYYFDEQDIILTDT